MGSSCVVVAFGLVLILVRVLPALCNRWKLNDMMTYSLSYDP